MAHRILRRPEVLNRLGCSRSTLYLRIAERTMPQPVRLGVRMIGWPETEIETLLAARIAGKTDDEIRTLVAKLETARKSVA